MVLFQENKRIAGTVSDLPAKLHSQSDPNWVELAVPERIYNPIAAIGFLAMFTFQLDNTKK